MHRGRIRWFIVVGLVLGIDVPAWAAHQPSSDLDHVRVTSAYSPDQGEFEIYQTTEFLNDGSSKSTKTFTRFEYGATDKLVLEFKVPFKFRRTDSGSNTEGLSDLELEAKYRLLSEPDFPISVAVAFEAGFPTGDEGRGLGNGNFKYEPIISVGKVFRDFSLHQDAKLELIRETGGSGIEVEASTTSAIVWTPVDEFAEIEHPAIYLALDWKFVENKRTKLALIPAIGGELEHLPIIDELEWGFGIPIGLSDAADNWGLIASFEVEF